MISALRNKQNVSSWKPETLSHLRQPEFLRKVFRVVIITSTFSRREEFEKKKEKNHTVRKETDSR